MGICPVEGVVGREVFELDGVEDLGGAYGGDCVVVGLEDIDAADFAGTGDKQDAFVY